jgi:hypothetical protein
MTRPDDGAGALREPEMAGVTVDLAADGGDDRAEVLALAKAALRVGKAALRGWHRADPEADEVRRLRRELGAVAMVVATLERPMR